jgi:hypothetical protein
MTDRYLKTVLTVIAFALCWIAGELTLGHARAQVGETGIKGVSITSPLVDAGAGSKSFKPDMKVVPVYCVNCASTK